MLYIAAEKYNNYDYTITSFVCVGYNLAFVATCCGKHDEIWTGICNMDVPL